MSKLIYKSEKPYQEDLNDLVVEDEIRKGRALPIGTIRTWGGKDYVKHHDGWVGVKSGKLTQGKNMQEVANHPNAAQHQEHAKKHGSSQKESAGSKEAKVAEGLATAHQGMAQVENKAKESSKPKSKVSNKLKDKPTHKELVNVKDEQSATTFVKQKLGITPRPDFRGSSGVYFDQSEEKTIISVELDRFRRHDHGGDSDGDGWLSSEEISKDYDKGVKAHEGKLKEAKRALKEMGIDAEVQFELGEKGHFALEIQMKNPNSWSSKLKSLSPEELKEVTVTSESGKVYTDPKKDERGSWTVQGDDGKRYGLGYGKKYKLS